MLKKTIKIVQSFDCIDLRKITSQTSFLQDQLKQFRMQHMDAVLYTNMLLTRFRLIMNLHGVGFLCIPEIDEAGKHSLYLKISDVLSKLSGVNRVLVNIDSIKSRIQEKADRQEERKSRSEQEVPYLRAVN